MEANQIKLAFVYDVGQYAGNVAVSKGAVTGVLSYACKNDTTRHMVLQFLTGKWSSKELTDAEWYALYNVVQPYKPEGGKWTTKRGESELEAIVGVIVRASLEASGQTSFDDVSPVRDGADEARKAALDDGVSV